MSEEKDNKKRNKNRSLQGMPDGLRDVIGNLKGRDASNDNMADDKSEIVFPIGNEIVRNILEEISEGTSEGGLNKNHIGINIDGKGIYIGSYMPFGEGVRQDSIFDIFSAPEDLFDVNGKSLVQSFAEAMQYVGELENYHGYDGAYYKEASDIIRAMMSGRYNGEWFVPTKKILKDQLYINRNAGELSNTFNRGGGLKGAMRWYRSSSVSVNDPDFVWAQRFTDSGGSSWVKHDEVELSLRLVRAEPR
jgi:hypothetical protein